jgi:serine/threonine-protein kinase
MSSDSHSAGEIELRLRQACAELDRRLREGEREVAQHLLDNDPDIAANEDLAIELIYTEFATLEELGADPSPHETLERFPQWRSRLERLLKVHDVFRGDDEIDLKCSSDTVAGLDSTYDGTSSRTDRADAPTRRKIGQYELLEEVDRGGTGIVYRAYQEGLNRIVAVKSIRSADASESERARFRAEAESAAKLQHPNIVQIYDVGEQDGREFLSMEYVEGGSLEKQLERERLSIREAAKLTATLAEAIHFAHERGIVHRDLKPGNILLADDVPKIGDFGLAKRMTAGAGAQTQTGALLGTPCYMSPEQAEGRTRDVGPTTDVYALGAILYELLVGRPPFLDDTPLKTMDLIRNREPERPSRIASKLPRDLETICLKCLSKKPAHRYTSARELADDLNRFLDHEPIHARRVSPFERVWRWTCRRPAISALAGTLLIVTIAGGFIVARQQRHVGELSRSADATKRQAAEIQQRAEAATADAGITLREAKQAIERLSSLGATLHDQPGMGETARQAIEQALEQYRVLLENHGEDNGVRREAARSFARAGGIQDELGQLTSAEETLKQGVQLYETLQRTAGIDFERAGIHVTLAHTERKLQKWEESKASFQAAIALLEELIRSDPTHDGYVLRLANALVNLSLVHIHDGHVEMAKHAYCRAIRLQMTAIERIAGFENSDTTDGGIENADEAARREILAVQALRRRVVDCGSRRLDGLIRGNYLFDLAQSTDDLGILLLDHGQVDMAEIALREALELRLLGTSHGQGGAWRQSYLARSHRNIGRLVCSRGDYQEATKAFEESVLILERLATEFPNRVPYQIDLGCDYTNIGNVMRHREQFDDALLNHRKAVAIHERLVRDDPTLQQLKDGLARSVYHMGRTLQSSGQTSDAVKHFQRSLELNPDLEGAANSLAWTLVMDPDHSIREPRRAVSIAQRAVELAPQSGSCCNTLGVAHYRNGDDDKAIVTLMRAIELRGGGDGFDWFFLAMAHARQGDEDLAREWFERAQTWCLTQDPLSDELQRIQAEASHAIKRLGH